MRVRKVDHVAIAVPSIAEAARLFVDVLGAAFLEGGDYPLRGMRTVQLMLGGVKLELVEPLDEHSEIRRFLDRHGPGFHHLTIYVDSLDDAIAELEAGGYEVVDTSEVIPGWRETYLRPRSAFGTLLQLVETDGPPAGLFEEITLEQVLAGRVTRGSNGWLPVVAPAEGVA